VIWTVVRILLALLALGTLFITPLWMEGPGGTEIVVVGAVIDLVALAVLVAVAWSWWRSRRPTAA
jgi:hypothetical protein